MSRCVYPTCKQCGEAWKVRCCDIASGKSSGTLCPACRNLGENNPNWRHGRGHDNYRYKLISIRRYPERHRARRLVQQEIRAGRIERGSCEVCGAGMAEAHHDDYRKPLDVRWLCPAHHRQADKQRKEMPQ